MNIACENSSITVIATATFTSGDIAIAMGLIDDLEELNGGDEYDIIQALKHSHVKEQIKTVIESQGSEVCQKHYNGWIKCVKKIGEIIAKEIESNKSYLD